MASRRTSLIMKPLSIIYLIFNRTFLFSSPSMCLIGAGFIFSVNYVSHFLVCKNVLNI